MKKICMILLAVVCITPLFGRSLGYSAGLTGETVKDNSYGGLSYALVYKPYERVWLNPSFSLGGFAAFDHQDKLCHPSISLNAGVSFYRIMNHPFWFLSHNKIAWEPSMDAGIQVKFDDGSYPAFLLEFSPFCFSQPDFHYEFFVPYFTFSDRQNSWGINLFRVTWFAL